MKRVIRIGEREALLDIAHNNGSINASVAWQGAESQQRLLDFREAEPGVYSVMCGNRSYEVRVLPGRDAWQVEIGGRSFSVEVEDPRNGHARRKGQGKEGRRDVTAPMPGKVVRVLVEAGATVEEGQGLVVVEAMKMQNEMKAPKSGTVIALAARTGASVTAGEVLVTLE
jgi:biotin carboxyl carrier protein